MDLMQKLLRLSPAQERAVAALANGATHEAAAASAGVARETVTRWASRHPAFREALEELRWSLTEEQQLAAVRIRTRALAIVEAQLAHLDDSNPRAFATAIAALRLLPFTPSTRPR